VLIGHDVIFNMLNDSHDEEGEPINSVPPGRLREVGDGYVIIQTESEEEGGFANEGAEWLVSIQQVTSIIHMIPECAGCAVDTASGNLRA
jgi:hypothetical protein